MRLTVMFSFQTGRLELRKSELLCLLLQTNLSARVDIEAQEKGNINVAALENITHELITY
jgi:hypothetical protein